MINVPNMDSMGNGPCKMYQTLKPLVLFFVDQGKLASPVPNLTTVFVQASSPSLNSMGSSLQQKRCAQEKALQQPC